MEVPSALLKLISSTGASFRFFSHSLCSATTRSPFGSTASIL